MTPTPREKPKPKPFKTYRCDRCKRDVQLAPHQQPPNYHRNNAGQWCVAPPSVKEIYESRPRTIARAANATR